MNNSFPSGGMSTSMNDQQFSLFIQFLKKSIPGGVKEAACCIGQQLHNCNIWVFGPNMQISNKGEILPEVEKLLWLEPIVVPSESVFSLSDLTPTIQVPFSSVVLVDLVNRLRIIMKHNFHSAMLVLAGGVMCLHYSTITRVYKGCPTILATGPAETGKSTAVAAALSIAGK